MIWAPAWDRATAIAAPMPVRAYFVCQWWSVGRGCSCGCGWRCAVITTTDTDYGPRDAPVTRAT